MGTNADTTTVSIPKIRTFAADLQAVRKDSGETTNPTAPTKPISALKETVSKNSPPSNATDTPPPIPPPPPSTTPPHAPSTNVKKPPPFHALQKKVRDEDISAISHSGSADRVSLLEDGSDSLSVNNPSDGTVVTDTKRRKQNFFTNIWRGLSEWFGDVKNTYITPEPPKYTVSGAYREKGVIRKAGVKSGKSLVDHKATISRIRQRKQQPAKQYETTITAPQLLLEAPDEPLPTVQPTTISIEARKTAVTKEHVALAEKEAALAERETKLRAAEREAQARIAAAEAKAELARTAVEAEAAAADLAFEAATTAQTAHITTPPEPDSSQTPPAVDAEITRQQAEAELRQLREDIARDAVAIINEQIAATDTDTDKVPPRSIREQLGETNFFSLITLTSIVALVVVVVIGNVVYQQLGTESPSPTATITTLPNSTSITLPTAATDPATDVIVAIRDAISGAEAPLVTIALINPTGEPLPTASIVTRLNFTIPPTFTRSLRTLQIGGYDRSYPFLVLTTPDYESAFGNMLNWETTLVRELVTLFAIQTNEATPEFTDDQIGTIDVRIYRGTSENGVVYGFINETTLLIAPNTPVFEQVAEQLQP